MTWTCAYCGRARPITVDHMFPRSLGGTDVPANLVPACGPCNNRKGAQVSEWLPCGRPSWLPYCIDQRCLKCAPAQIEAESRMLAITSAALVAKHNTKRRDRLIRQAHTEGGTLRELGMAAGMHFTSVRKIIQRDQGGGR